MMRQTQKSSMRIALVVPHIFIIKELINNVIFAPGTLALDLAQKLQERGNDVTLFTPGETSTTVKNMTVDLSLFYKELEQREYGFIELLKKHPLTFITLSRQVQSELISLAYEMANDNKFDVVHVYTNDEELAMVFAKFCKKPIVFTHHEPFNYLAKYRSSFGKYKNLSWLSISLSQRKSMPMDTNWIGNIYHGIAKERFLPVENPSRDYFLYYGRIIEPKGVHLAIKACKKANQKLIIAGKHYSDFNNDQYWNNIIEPEVDNDLIKYVGFINKDLERQELLGNAKALIVPSIWEEPFGMVMIEALACGTPIIGLNSGSISEIVLDGYNGLIVSKVEGVESSNGKNKSIVDEVQTINNMISKINDIDKINTQNCRKDFEARFTLDRMAQEHEEIYHRLSGG